jgi:esterase/lipase
MSKIETWHEYYQYARLDPNAVRPGCEPRYIVNDNPTTNTIVLVHGLTDSPFFMAAIGRYFHEEMGFNVYMPLLAGHGLKEPRGMQGVSLQQWIADVDFALDCAQASSGNIAISIGGLSTGGALSVHRALHLPERITGGIFLFSAALDLAGKYGDLDGDLQEFLLRLDPLTAILGTLEDKLDLIGKNPYRYARRDIHGATQLAVLIKELDERLVDARLNQPLFAAHSMADNTADIGVARRSD